MAWGPSGSGAVFQDSDEKPRGARAADKAGWIKKSSGGFLGLWKDRYLLLCQAQLLVCESEVSQRLGRAVSQDRTLRRTWRSQASVEGPAGGLSQARGGGRPRQEPLTR